MKKLLTIAFLALACAREQHPPQLVPKRCDGLCGHVVDAKTKQPIREFTVYMLAPRTGPAPSRQIKMPPGYPQPVGELIEERVIESTDGSFVLRTPPVPVYVAVSARGYKSMTTATPVGASTEVKIELAHARQIRGHVSDERGQPIANARVSETTSDANGDFTIDEPPGPWRELDISDDRHLPQRVIVYAEDSRIEVTLHDPAANDARDATPAVPPPRRSPPQSPPR